MAPKRATKAKSKADDDFAFAASQQSSASSDDAFQTAVAEQIMAAQDKKKKEKERRFLTNAGRRIDGETEAAAESFRTSLEEVQTAFSTFVQEYAQVEDEIRRLWTEVGKIGVGSLAHTRQTVNIEADRARKDAQVAGLAAMAGAGADMDALISLMDAPGAAGGGAEV
ncbi:hypothetical protein GGF50DRAFT_129525 [Schizophyllum commune]